MTTVEELTRHDNRTNVSDPERWVSVVAGGALAAYGLIRRSRTSLALASVGGALLWRGTTGRCPAYQALGVSTAIDVEKRGQVSVPYGKGIHVERSVTIDATPEKLYEFWRNFENLPRFMRHLQSVSVQDNKRSHWVTRGPAGMRAEWDAEIINEVPNELIGWRSLEGSTVNNAGSVHFERATGDRGTVVRVTLRYDPPGGKLGAAFARLFGEGPQRQVNEDLRALKQILEAGELATTEGQPTGR